ncbi:unnamed protein product (macronuclear) [Paramecium tetraurelia]|uniref:Uncharacterized protein n=1 Tax=Paramecium tetraurelia TaxID=5888 RepID=A0D768_PARTE|nr:uncharacterized protein GSPATT00001926001 [Paramecium tetraurelia]CAK78885.1 unnamed protein product [Paramecium tetraurelia]|eukprot:XP_001446282.1 hypothetical protein (macronuclear) [Paramecium tetraurelia strain d4-2]
MSEENISQRNQFELVKHANAVKRFENLEKLKLIDRLETLEKIKKSNDRLEIKKFMFQLQQRMFDAPDQFSIIKFSIGLKLILENMPKEVQRNQSVIRNFLALLIHARLQQPRNKQKQKKLRLNHLKCDSFNQLYMIAIIHTNINQSNIHLTGLNDDQFLLFKNYRIIFI